MRIHFVVETLRVARALRNRLILTSEEMEKLEDVLDQIENVPTRRRYVGIEKL